MPMQHDKLEDTVRVVLSLGSNIDKEHNLPRAVALLRERVAVLAVSGVYETAPVGLTAQPNFWNCAVLCEVGVSAEILKTTTLTEIETRLKRQRSADKNAPRTIDLDIALFGDQITPYLERPLPDPDILTFAHVAVPIADLLPNQPHPVTGETLHAIASRLAGRANQTTRTIWKVSEGAALARDPDSTSSQI